MNEGTADAAAATDSRWWLPIAALVGVVVLQGVLSIVLPPDPETLFPFIAPLVVVGLALQLCSPVCLYYDRRYLSAVADWTPSKWYYAMLFPPLSVVLAPLYLYQRQQRVGVP